VLLAAIFSSRKVPDWKTVNEPGISQNINAHFCRISAKKSSGTAKPGR